MKKLVVLTGAGISAESGLKTFRDPNETAVGSTRKVEFIRMKAGKGVAEFIRMARG